MTLKKLTNDHYIIVDDSEIDYDNEPYLLIKDDYETYIHIRDFVEQVKKR